MASTCGCTERERRPYQVRPRQDRVVVQVREGMVVVVVVVMGVGMGMDIVAVDEVMGQVQADMRIATGSDRVREARMGVRGVKCVRAWERST